MKIGILYLNDNNLPGNYQPPCITGVSKKLNQRGYIVDSSIFTSSPDKILAAFDLLKADSNSIIIAGNYEMLDNLISAKNSNIEPLNAELTKDAQLETEQPDAEQLKTEQPKKNQSSSENSDIVTDNVDCLPKSQLISKSIDGVLCVFVRELTENFAENVLLPFYATSLKTHYSTSIFKTFNKTETELREMLKSEVKNRHRITFSFYPSLLECDVYIRYSGKSDYAAVTETIANVTEILSGCTYALKDISLSAQVAQLLYLRGKTIAVAESFTGGGVAAALVENAGMSASFTEGIVSYSNSAKISRLKVEDAIIKRYGAVSIETVYEMAANLLLDSGCDLVIATTGNAGPTSEKPEENGVCYIAVGDMSGIHIYKYRFDGDRKNVIQSGVKTALYNLYNLLKEKDFKKVLLQQSSGAKE